jgi:hypothetical protein
LVLATATLLSGCGYRGNPGASAGVVTGRVLTAPTCPVARVPQSCPAKPVAGALVIALVGNQRRASTNTDQTGGFRMTLPVGHYTVRATNPGRYASTAARQLDVSDVPVDITLTVDSGIRCLFVSRMQIQRTQGQLSTCGFVPRPRMKITLPPS